MRKPIKPSGRFIPDTVWVDEIDLSESDLVFVQSQQQADAYARFYTDQLKLNYGAVEFDTLYDEECL